MHRPFRCLRALLIIVVFASSASADPPEIRAGSELDFRPYCFTDRDGRPTGFGVELLQAVAEKATLHLSITPGEWDHVWNQLVTGQIDVLPVVARTPGREGFVDFSLPHTETFDAFFVRTGNPPIPDLSQAAGREIVVLRSDAAHHQLLERGFAGTIVPVDSIREGLRLVATGRHDALLCSRLIGVIEREQAGISGVADGPVIPDYKRVFSFAVHKGNTELVERLNLGLRLVKADGTYDRIYRKWLGIPTEAHADWWDYFWRVVAIAGTLALLGLTLVLGRKVLQQESRMPTPPESRSPALSEMALHYAIAPLSVVAALMLQRGLSTWVGPGLPPFLLFYLPILGVALIAGFGPGLLSVALSAVAVRVWIIEPIGEWSVAALSEHVSLGLFSLNAMFMCAVVHLYRGTRSKAAAYARDAAVRESEDRLRLFEVTALNDLHALSTRLLTAPNLQAVAQQTLESCVKLVGADSGTIQGYDPVAGNLVFLATQGFDPGAIDSLPAIGPDYHSTCGRALNAGQRIIVEDFHADPAAAEHRKTADALGYRAAQSTPLLAKGQIIGMITTHFRRPRRFTDRELRLIDLVASYTAALMERTHAEDAMRRSEARYRVLHESMRDAFVKVDMDGRILEFNEPYRAMLGYTPEEMSTLTYQAVTPERWHAWEAAIVRDQIVARGYSDVYQKEYRRKDGSVFPVELRTILMRDSEGRPAAMWGIVRDITARKQAEEALASAHRKTQSIIDNTPDIVYAFDLESKFLLANTTVAALFNTTPKEMIGRRRHDFMPVEDAQRHESNDRKVIEAGRTLEFEEFSCFEGRSITWLTKKFPLRDAQGAIYGVAGISADISERKRFEDQLQRLNETLEVKVMERTADLHAANQALAERAAQLRRLAAELTTAEQRERRSIAKLLHDGLQQYLVAAQLRQGILIGELGEHEGGQTAREVEGLLTESIKVSRSLATELCPPVLDGGILAGLEWLTRFMASKHGLEVDLIVETGAPILAEDVKIFLFESVRELLLNVVKHSQARSAKVHLREAGTKLSVTVSDCGSGFDPSALERREIAGGFGLFSIRERIGLIGGAIEIESAPGEGARFQLSVPFEKPAPVKAAPAPFEPARNARAGAAGRIRILLADDHKVVREGLARILGAETDLEIVGQAEDGNMAVELTEALRPSVVLMDLNMPGMDGITATRIIAQAHPDVHVIGLSFYSAEERADEMLRAGAGMYVSKTAPAEELKEAIRSCIKGNATRVQSSPSDDPASPPVLPIARITRMPS